MTYQQSHNQKFHRSSSRYSESKFLCHGVFLTLTRKCLRVVCLWLSVKVVPLYCRQSLICRHVLLSKSANHFHKRWFCPKRFFFSQEKALREHIFLHRMPTNNLGQSISAFFPCYFSVFSVVSWMECGLEKLNTIVSHPNSQEPQFYHLNHVWLLYKETVLRSAWHPASAISHVWKKNDSKNPSTVRIKPQRFCQKNVSPCTTALWRSGVIWLVLPYHSTGFLFGKDSRNN